MKHVKKELAALLKNNLQEGLLAVCPTAAAS